MSDLIDQVCRKSATASLGIGLWRFLKRVGAWLSARFKHKPREMEL